MIKNYSVFIGLIIIVVVMFLTGCTYRNANMEAWKGDNRLKEDYGNSQRLAISNQTLNPEAGKDLKPVYGFDGRAAEKVVEGQYIKRFDKPAVETGSSYGGGGGIGGK